MEITFHLARESAFKYVCNRCRKCCHDKRILLNPYELIRLAQNRAITTTELIERFTEEGGTVLRFGGPDNACQFLGPEGCTVHPDRPLACRLYPLGRYSSNQGEEAFSVLQGHPESLGEYPASESLGEADTVGTFLSSQDVEPYFQGARRYYALFQQLAGIAAETADSPAGSEPAESDEENMLDADAVIESYCRRTGAERPGSAEEKMDLHIRALTAWAESLGRGPASR